MKYISTYLGTIFFLAFSSCDMPNESHAVEPGIAIELAKNRKARLSDVSYDLHFSIPEEVPEPIDGEVTIRFSHKGEPKEDLQLDFRAIAEDVKAVRVGEEPAEIDFREEHLVIPAAALSEGNNQISIAFKAGDLSLNRNDDFLYTLLVPDRASTVFPCMDQPNLKASFELSLEIPESWSALSNGAVASDSTREGRRFVQFEASAPISTYLFAFTAGQFQSETTIRDGREMTMFYRESDVEKVSRNVPEIFDLHATALAYMESYTTIPMPFKKFDFALIPGFQYGGMEHVGAIFYRESSLMLDENATENRQLSRAALIAHETAHMWFGDLVTMEWFDDVWLKEVFANFMAAKIVNPTFPEINHELNFLFRHHPAAYGEDRSGGSHPIQQPLENLKDAGALYGRIIYQKAPIVMRQLEETMGPVAMRDGLRAYLHQFAYGNASWDDLIAILDQRTEADLKEWSAVWVKEAQMPVFDQHWEESDEGVTINFQQRYPSASGNYWSEKTEAAIWGRDSITRIPLYLRSEEQAGQISLTGKPLAVLPHASPISYGYFPLDTTSQSYLLANVADVEDPLLRGSIWVALYEDVIRGQLSPERFFDALLQALPRETEPLNRNNLLRNVQVIYGLFLPEATRSAQRQEVEKILAKGWEQPLNTSSQTAYFRTYFQLAQSPGALAELRAIWAGEQEVTGLKLSEADRIDLMAELAIRLPKQADSLIAQQMRATDNPDRLRRLTFIQPALSPDAAVRDSFFNGLAQLENRSIEPWVVDAVNYLHHPSRLPHARQYILPSLELLEEIKATGDIFFPRQFISATLGNHNSAEAAAIVQTFLDNRPDYPFRLKNKILMAGDLLLRSVQ